VDKLSGDQETVWTEKIRTDDSGPALFGGYSLEHGVCVKVTSKTVSPVDYAPELYLCQYLVDHCGVPPEEAVVYCFCRMGVQPLSRMYETLHERLSFDALVLADGGTDSLCRGDECKLGTPGERERESRVIDHTDR
jgi:hypothetical protein